MLQPYEVYSFAISDRSQYGPKLKDEGTWLVGSKLCNESPSWNRLFIAQPAMRFPDRNSASHSVMNSGAKISRRAHFKEQSYV